MRLPALRTANPIVIIGVIGYLSVSLYGMANQRIGRLQSQLHVRDSTIAVLQKSARKTDTVYTRDTIRLTKWQTKYVTSRDTLLQHLTDTLRIKEYVHVADSTINACSQVVTSCETRVSQRDSIIGLQALQIKTLGRKGKLFGFLPAPSKTLVFGVGLASGYLLAK